MGVALSKGVEIRAQIDTEVVRGLLLLNGGGAIALLALLPSVVGVEGFEILTRGILWALICLQLGLIGAVVHNRLRRVCSHLHELHGMKPPAGMFLGLKLKQPRVCFLSESFMWGSLVWFFVGGAVVSITGLFAV